MPVFIFCFYIEWLQDLKRADAVKRNGDSRKTGQVMVQWSRNRRHGELSAEKTAHTLFAGRVGVGKAF